MSFGLNVVTMWHNVAQMSSVNFVNYFGRLGVAFLSPFCVVAFSAPKCAEQDSRWPLSEGWPLSESKALSGRFWKDFSLWDFLFIYIFYF